MNQEEIGFQFKNIEILEFSFKHPLMEIPENTPFKFDINIEHKVNIEEKVIMVISSFNIFFDEMNEKTGKAVISCIYHIDNIHQFVDKTDKFSLSDNLITMFNSISISTCRGVLFSLFRGTPLQSVLLPIINPRNLVKNGIN